MRIESPFGVSCLRDKNININHVTEGRKEIEEERGNEREKESETRATRIGRLFDSLCASPRATLLWHRRISSATLAISAVKTYG